MPLFQRMPNAHHNAISRILLTRAVMCMFKNKYGNRYFVFFLGLDVNINVCLLVNEVIFSMQYDLTEIYHRTAI